MLVFGQGEKTELVKAEISFPCPLTVKFPTYRYAQHCTMHPDAHTLTSYQVTLRLVQWYRYSSVWRLVRYRTLPLRDFATEVVSQTRSQAPQRPTFCTQCITAVRRLCNLNPKTGAPLTFRFHNGTIAHLVHLVLCGAWFSNWPSILKFSHVWWDVTWPPWILSNDDPTRKMPAVRGATRMWATAFFCLLYNLRVNMLNMIVMVLFNFIGATTV